MSLFESIKTDSGEVSARHTATGVLIHGSVQPRNEARSMARRLAVENVRQVFVVGHGLGYFTEALSELGIECNSVEVFDELGELCRSAGRYPCDAVVKSPRDLQERITNLLPDTRLIILPYVLSLRDSLPESIAEFIEFLHVTTQSQQLYRALITTNIGTNEAQLELTERLSIVQSRSRKIAVALGAGPTLSAALDTLREHRDDLCLVAASGAVPVLVKENVVADWIVAMEARDAVARDVDAAADGARVIVFPWTHPSVVNEKRFDLFLADEAHGLETSGGSTGLAAADFALKICSSAVFMIGMDMSDKSGEYSRGSERESANLSLRAPKFSVMRSAASRWAKTHDDRRIYHMIMPGDEALAGARQIYPVELATELAREHSRRNLLAESLK